MEGLLTTLVARFEAHGISLEAWALAWARLAPAAVLLPALGARLLPPVGRAVLGLALAFTLAPALAPLLPSSSSPWPVALLHQFALGLPIALSASAFLWAIEMAGGLMDELRGSGQVVQVSMFERSGNSIGALFGLFGAIGFLLLGGVSRLIEALAAPALAVPGLFTRAVTDLAASIGIAIALAAPLLAAAILFEVAGALMVRAASPAHLRPLLAPARSLFLLLLLGIALDTLFDFIITMLPDTW